MLIEAQKNLIYVAQVMLLNSQALQLQGFHTWVWYNQNHDDFKEFPLTAGNHINIQHS